VLIAAALPAPGGALGIEWYVSIMDNEGSAVYGTALADVDGDGYEELITVGGSAGITVRYQDGRMEHAFNGTKTLLKVAVGDAYPPHPGVEIFAVGTDRSVHMVYLENGTWHHQELYHGISSVNGVAVADFYSGSRGKEVAFVGDDALVGLLWYTDSGWQTITTKLQEKNITNMNCAAYGSTLLVATFNGRVYTGRYSGNWSFESIYQDSMAVLNFMAAGSTFYATTFSGRVVEFHMENSTWNHTVILKDDNPVYTLTSGSFGTDRQYMVACGIGSYCYVMQRQDAWHAERLYGEGLEGVYHGSYGYFRGEYRTILGTIGGALVSVSRTVPDFELVPLYTNTTSSTGPVQFHILTRGVGNFYDRIFFSCSQACRLDPASVLPGEGATVEVDPALLGPGEHTVTLDAFSSTRHHSVQLHITVRDGAPWIRAHPVVQHTLPGYAVSFVVESSTAPKVLGSTWEVEHLTGDHYTVTGLTQSGPECAVLMALSNGTAAYAPVCVYTLQPGHTALVPRADSTVYRGAPGTDVQVKLTVVPVNARSLPFDVSTGGAGGGSFTAPYSGVLNITVEGTAAYVQIITFSTGDFTAHLPVLVVPVAEAGSMFPQHVVVPPGADAVFISPEPGDLRVLSDLPHTLDGDLMVFHTPQAEGTHRVVVVSSTASYTGTVVVDRDAYTLGYSYHQYMGVYAVDLDVPEGCAVEIIGEGIKLWWDRGPVVLSGGTYLLLPHGCRCAPAVLTLPETRENLSLTLEVHPGPGSVRYTATVTNTGTVPVCGTASVYLSGKVLEEAPLVLMPGETVSLHGTADADPGGQRVQLLVSTSSGTYSRSQTADVKPSLLPLYLSAAVFGAVLYYTAAGCCKKD